MSAYMVLSHAERVLFRAILGIEEADKQMNAHKWRTSLYDAVAGRCFALDLRGRAVDAFRRGYRGFKAIDIVETSPYPGTEEYDKLIAIARVNPADFCEEYFFIKTEAEKRWLSIPFNGLTVEAIATALDQMEALEVMAEWQTMDSDTTYMDAFMRFVNGTATRQQR